MFKVQGLTVAKIKVKELALGMTLTADVCDPNGRFLLGAGCELNDKHIKALNAWGVISVEIRPEDMPVGKSNVEISPKFYAVIEKHVSERFVHNDMSVPFIKELSGASVRFLAERLGD